MDGVIPAKTAFDDSQNQSRGWWDPVLKQEPIFQDIPRQVHPRPEGFFAGLLGSFVHRSSGENTYPENSQHIQVVRKTSTQGEFPLAQPPRTSRLTQTLQPRAPVASSGPDYKRTSVPSSRLSRLIPRMVLFKQVMRDELCYTTVIAGGYAFLTILVLLGTQLPIGLQMYHAVNLNWGLISLLSIHSFGRVVKRHEKEALLQHPSTWEYSPRSDSSHNHLRQRRAWSPTATSSISFRRGSRTTSSSDTEGSPGVTSLTRSWRASTTRSLLPSPSLDAFSWRAPSPHVPRILPSPSFDAVEFLRDEITHPPVKDGDRLLPRAKS
jgi:hypothetical protein